MGRIEKVLGLCEAFDPEQAIDLFLDEKSDDIQELSIILFNMICTWSLAPRELEPQSVKSLLRNVALLSAYNFVVWPWVKIAQDQEDDWLSVFIDDDFPNLIAKLFMPLGGFESIVRGNRLAEFTGHVETFWNSGKTAALMAGFILRSAESNLPGPPSVNKAFHFIS